MVYGLKTSSHADETADLQSTQHEDAADHLFPMSIHLQLPNHRPWHDEGCDAEHHLNDGCARVHGELVDHFSWFVSPFPRDWENLEERGEEEADEPTDDNNVDYCFGCLEFASGENAAVEEDRELA